LAGVNAGAAFLHTDGLPGAVAAVGYAFDLVQPAANGVPVLVTSPHSGRLYPLAMQRLLAVSVDALRATEDAYVDELFSHAPEAGATLLTARYARSVVDLNRDARELDPDMFADGLPRPSGLATARVAAGLGCLPRVGARGEAIYCGHLSRAEGEARLSLVYEPYHACLQGELARLTGQHGGAVLIDCHSMPSVQPGRRALPDIVLGDRFGASCDGRLTSRVERAFKDHGFSVARNAPYAGGYTTQRYGNPRRNVHALQIELNRCLYMNEHSRERSGGFQPLRAQLDRIIPEIVAASAQVLHG
jgi:N-formylglutamate amidohydrolase